MRDSKSSGKKPIQEVQAPRAHKAKLERLRRDITERKKAEEALRESEERFRGIFENSLVGLYRTTPDGRILMVNPALVHMLGYSSFEELAQRNLEENGFMPEYPRSVFKQRIEGDGQVIGLEAAWTKRDGTTLFVRESARAVRDELGNTLYYEGTVEDITEHKKAEEALRKSEEKYRTLYETSRDGIAGGPMDGRILECNRAFADMLGYSKEELSNLTYQQLTPKRWHQMEADIVREQILKRGYSDEYEKEYIRKDGTVFLISARVWLVRGEKGKPMGMWGTVRDITERKKAEELLRNAEKDWRNSFDSLEDVMLIIDTDYNIENINEVGLKLLGKSKEEVIGKKCYQIISDVDSAAEGCPCTKSLKTKKVESLDWYENKFGKYFSIKSSPIFDENGEIIKFVDLRRDITERKKAEVALRASEQRYRTLIESSHEVILCKDRDGHYHTLNLKAAIGLGGTCIEDIEGKTDYDLLPKEQADALRKIDKEIMESGKDMEVEEVVRDAQGENRVYLSHKWPIYYRKGRINGISCFAMDITEHKRAEEKLLEYQAQLRSLASELSLAEERERRRIATELHDQISQSLVISKMKVDRLRESASGKELSKALDEIANSLCRTIADTRSLTSDIHPPLLALLGFEEAVAEWLSKQIQEKHGIAAEFEDDGLPKPLDDDIRILLFRDVRELLTNVVRHAHAHKVKVSIRKVDDKICVTVEDDGVGFDPAEVASIGLETNGFGLFSIQERLEELGGHLEIEFEPGQGAKVTITAPLQGANIAEGRKI